LQAHGGITGLIVVSVILRCFRLNDWPGQLIGDECWYVQDARVILGFPLANFKNLPAHPLSGLDPNSEHGPLAKLIMALFMKLFGDNGTAWRAPSVILGTLGIWMLYLIVQRLGAGKRTALFAAFVLAFDNLSFQHGRIAMLDIYLTSFILLGSWLYLAEFYELAGLAFALSALCKINGLLGLGAIIMFDMMVGFRSAWQGSWRATLRWPVLRPTWRKWRPAVITTAFFTAFFLTMLGGLDNYFTEFKGPFEHLWHMVTYHTGLTHHGVSTGNESSPLQWFFDQGTMDYFVWTWSANGKATHMIFHAALNEYVVWAAPFALFFAGQRAWTDSSKLGMFALASFVGNFGPMFLAWAILSRTSYIFYMVPAVPSFACAIALVAEKIPRSVRWFYSLLLVYAFFFNFPFRYFGY
jgi:predicted membrane-bound dolichyl-phosphate-mannose-protein mannosyltransferase